VLELTQLLVGKRTKSKLFKGSLGGEEEMNTRDGPIKLSLTVRLASFQGIIRSGSPVNCSWHGTPGPSQSFKHVNGFASLAWRKNCPIGRHGETMLPPVEFGRRYVVGSVSENTENPENPSELGGS
jgi:hypothetical protein